MMRSKRPIRIVLIAVGLVAVIGGVSGCDGRGVVHPSGTGSPRGSDNPSSESSGPAPAYVVDLARHRPAPKGWKTWRQPGLILHFPPRWQATDFDGLPAPTAVPVVYLAEHHLGGRCPAAGRGPTDRAGTTSCFNGTWRVPAHEVIVRWVRVDQPDYRVSAVGRRTRIDGRSGAVHVGRPDSCSDGASSEISAAVAVSRDHSGGGDYEMTACFGAHAASRERDAVTTMLATMQISGD